MDNKEDKVVLTQEELLVYGVVFANEYARYPDNVKIDGDKVVIVRSKQDISFASISKINDKILKDMREALEGKSDNDRQEKD